MPSSVARAMCARVVPRVRPVIDAARVGPPVRRAEAGERGDDDHAAGVRDLARERLDLGRLLEQAEPVAQPLHRGAGDERGALERVAQLAARRAATRRS